MPSANLDLVRSIYAAWERGDFSSSEWAHAEIEFVMADGPSPRTWTGLTGMADSTRDFMGAWKDFRIVADEFREIERGRVLVLVHYEGHGKASGLDVEQMQAKGLHMYHLRDGKVTRRIVYFDRARGIADLGLAPKGESRR